MSERKVIPENGRIDELIASLVVAGVRCQDANAEAAELLVEWLECRVGRTAGLRDRTWKWLASTAGQREGR